MLGRTSGPEGEVLSGECYFTSPASAINENGGLKPNSVKCSVFFRKESSKEIALIPIPANVENLILRPARLPLTDN